MRLKAMLAGLLIASSCLLEGYRIGHFGFDLGLIDVAQGKMPFDWSWFAVDLAAGLTMLPAYILILTILRERE